MSANDVIPLLSAVLVGTLLQSTAYGVFLVLCFRSFQVLFANKQLSKMHRVTLGITIFQLVLITGHWVLNLSRLFDAFIYAQNLPMGSILYYATIAHPKYLTFTALYVFQAVVTDCFMVYRLYVIWGNSKWICVFPILSVLALMVAGPAIIVTFSKLVIGENVFISIAQPYILLSLGSNLCTNVYCSSMITYKIWTSERRLQRLGLLSLDSTRFTRTMHIIIDSAGIFTAVTLSAFVAYVLQSNFHFICVDIATPTIGITFCLIIVRVGGRVDQAGSTNFTTHHNTNNKIRTVNTNNSRRAEFALSPMSTVQITKEVQSESDLDVSNSKSSMEMLDA